MRYIMRIIEFLIITIVAIIIINVIIVFIKKYLRKNKIKKFKNIECSNFNNEISIDDEKVRKILLYEINKIKDHLQRIYLKSDWDTKRFLYEIIKDLAAIRYNLENNTLNEADIYKINIIIEILKLENNLNGVCEKVIFEWEKIL